MTPIIALAGLSGLSLKDEFWFTGAALLSMLVQALFFPIFTFDHPPQWMVFLQPLIVAAGLIGVHFWLRARRLRPHKRIFLYMASYCLLLFTTNMAGEARGVFCLARDMIQLVRLSVSGQGDPADTRP